MENEPRINQETEMHVIDGKKYRRVFSGYTIRQYYSHDTPEKGPGPGWDFRQKMLEKYDVNNPSELPDEPHYDWEEIGE